MQSPSAGMPAEQSETTRDSIATPEASRAIHPCEARKRSGEPCGRYVATVWLDGAWRCPSHRPRRIKDAATPPRTPKPPVTELRSLADVERLSSWAAVQVARGRLDHQRSNALAAQCREFRQAREAAKDHRLADGLLDALLRYWDAQAVQDADGMRDAAADAQRLITQHRPEGATE